MKRRILTAVFVTLCWTSSQAVTVTNNTVQNGPQNIALSANGAIATQSSLASGGVPERGNDGITSGAWGTGSVTHTDPGAALPAWWTVDLGSIQQIDWITLWNRTDCCGDRLANIRVSIRDTELGPDTWSVEIGTGGTPVGGNETVTPPPSTLGQWVRVEKFAGAGSAPSVLSLAEVQVFQDAGGLPNTAVNGTATASSANNGNIPENSARAIDGNTSGAWADGSVSHTADSTQGGGPDEFWEVNLNAPVEIVELALYNRADCCGDRLSNFSVTILDQARTELFYFDDLTFADFLPNGAVLSLTDDLGAALATGSIVRVQLIGYNLTGPPGDTVLALAEVEVYGNTVDIFTGDDLDSDNLVDAWEEFWFGNTSISDGTADDDMDGLDDLGEFTARTSPANPDSDVDTLLDGEEVLTHGTSPLKADTDEDDFDDWIEIVANSVPTDPGSIPEIRLTTAHGVGNAWTNGTTWSDGMAAGAGNDYFVIDSVADTIRSPEGAGTTFPGDSLTLIGGGTRLRLKGDNDTTTTFPDLHMYGGAIDNSLGLRLGLDGAITVDTGMLLDLIGTDLAMIVNAQLLGDGPTTVRNFSAGPGSVNIAGHNNPYSGDWTVTGNCTVLATGAGALGSGDIELAWGTLVPHGIAGFDATLTIGYDDVNFNRGVFDANGKDHYFKAILLGTNAVAPGVYTDFNALVDTTGLVQFYDSFVGTGRITVLGTTNGDANGNGLPDQWEADMGITGQAATADPDVDGLNHLNEFHANSIPTNPDSDGDTLNDGDEVFVHSTDPTNADSDGDTLSDSAEISGVPATDPNNPDTDGDGLTDDVETNTGIWNGPTDTGTDPTNPDSDGDAFNDGEEVAKGTDPNDENDLPDPSVFLLAHWPFDETSGTAVADIAGNNYSGAISGDPNWQPTGGAVGGALEFDFTNGTNDLVTVVSNDDLKLQIPTFTVMCFANPATADHGMMLAQGRGCSTWASWFLSIGGSERNENGNLYSFGVRNAGAGDNERVEGPEPVVPGMWTHIAVTFDGTDLVLYLDGVEVDRNPTGFGPYLNTESEFYMGMDPGCSERFFFDGKLDEVQIYNTDLSAVLIEGLIPDTDTDGIYDHIELSVAGDLTTLSANGDADSDGLTDLEEINAGLNPTNPDVDDDGLNDGDEIAAGTDPRVPDSDNDGVKDGDEGPAGTDPLVLDTDNDGWRDGIELAQGSSPTNSASTPVFGAGQLGVNFTHTAFVANEDDVLAAESAGAGVYAQMNWNNADGSAGSTSVVDSVGAAVTGLGVEWTSPNTWTTTGAAGNTTPNDRLLNGYLDDSSGATITLSAIPYGQYHVLVYVDGDNPALPMGAYSLASPGGTLVSGAPVYGANIVGLNDTLIEIPVSSTDRDTAPEGNYIVFKDVKQDSLVIQGLRDVGLSRSSICAIQVISVPPTVVVPGFDVTGATVDAGGGTYSVSWESVDGAAYSVESSDSEGIITNGWMVIPGAESVPAAAGGATVYEGTGEPPAFLRVNRIP